VKSRYWLAPIAGAALAVSLTGIGASASPGRLADASSSKASAMTALSNRAATSAPVASLNTPMARTGHGAATARVVSARALSRARQLPATPAIRPAPATIRPFTAPTAVTFNVDGISEGTSDCVDCNVPDPSAAVGTTQVAQVANSQLAVYNKSGSQLCSDPLSSLLGTTATLFEPRIQYDNVNSRYSMIADIEISSLTASPAMYLAASQTNDACGSWFVYHIGFSGGSYPAGTAVRAYLGQDRPALLFSSDNITPPGDPINSTVWSIAKSAVYSGAAVSFGSFNVAEFTEPVIVSGNPIPATTSTYFVAAATSPSNAGQGTGYDLYRMTNSAGPGTSLVLQAFISSPFNVQGNVFQSGPAVQSHGLVWFTHGFELGDFPSVRYGEINTANNTATVAEAFRSGTSDDFISSIGISDAAGGVYVWLNWVFTDTTRGVGASDTVDVLLPGQPVQNLIGTGLVLKNSLTTSVPFDLGETSSVAIDPGGPFRSLCAAGKTAVVTQEYLAADGSWATDLARVSFC